MMLFYYNCIFLYIPNNFKYILLNNNKGYFLCYFNLKKFIKAPINSSIFIKNNLLIIYYRDTDFIIKYFKKFFFFFFFNWNTFIVKKIKFKHKMIWIIIKRKIIKNIVLNFIKSHKVKYYLNNIRVIRKKKHLSFHTLVIWGLNYQHMYGILNNIRQQQYITIYTYRGVKFSRQLIYKKQGKVSRYTMLKSKIF
uniref:Ribosomal protein L6 n=1 Tax=Gruberia lanceolata TaxID=1978530 RepID=A0A6C0UA36_9CILI|nr:ribosomal protein L6 [Gruberia lanceolata]